MTRTIWKGAISFGLVHIAVEMYPAVVDHGLDLTMLDKRDNKGNHKGNHKAVV